ncbi:hypothetical protein GQ53DRAFT_754311 [Thozetella sp. PMI_491]|nr:hypothetical protein GQ53DRAFT_754311 [Thozetella sp. PMI_491]
MLGWAWFSVWSLACGFCGPSDLVMFSTFRGFQGIGPALLIPNAIALIGRTFPVGLKRNLAFACFGACGPTGAAVGAIFAALVAQTISWHWCFWLLSMTCAALIPLSYFLVPHDQPAEALANSNPPPPVSDLSPSTVPPRFDWPGAVTGVAGLLLVNLALNQAPLDGWNTPYIGALLVIGVIFLCVFSYVEVFYASHPLIPLRGLQRNALLALACVFAGWSSHGIWVYYLFIFLEHLRRHSALLTSFEMCPVAVTGVFFAFSTVWMLQRIPVSWVMFMAMFFFVLGSLLIAVTPLNQIYWGTTFVSIALMPGAMNLSFPAATILLSSALPKEKQGIAASLVATMVNYSISCGLGLAGSLHKSTLMRATANAGFTGPAPPLSQSNDELVAIRLVGLRAAYWFSVALGGVGLCIATLFILLSVKRDSTPEVDDKGRQAQVHNTKKGGISPQSASPPAMSKEELAAPAAAHSNSNQGYNHYIARSWV